MAAKYCKTGIGQAGDEPPPDGADEVVVVGEPLEDLVEAADRFAHSDHAGRRGPGKRAPSFSSASARLCPCSIPSPSRRYSAFCARPRAFLHDGQRAANRQPRIEHGAQLAAEGGELFSTPGARAIAFAASRTGNEFNHANYTKRRIWNTDCAKNPNSRTGR